MKKCFAVLSFLIILSSSNAQDGYVDVGYTTTDVGVDFKTFSDGSFVGLHLGFGAKLHHAFHGSIGYYMAKNNTPSYYSNKTKGGLGVNIGYRYYTKPRPDGFFIGIDASLFTNKITVNTQAQETRTSKKLIPSFQTGYMLLINDFFFITPNISFGYKTNLDSLLKADEKKFVTMFGVSAGFKF